MKNLFCSTVMEFVTPTYQLSTQVQDVNTKKSTSIADAFASQSHPPHKKPSPSNRNGIDS